MPSFSFVRAWNLCKLMQLRTKRLREQKFSGLVRKVSQQKHETSQNWSIFAARCMNEVNIWVYTCCKIGGCLCQLLLWYIYTYILSQIISSLHWVLGITCRKPLKAWVYTNKIEKLRLLLKLTLLEICA